jgi:hypothetical protein
MTIAIELAGGSLIFLGVCVLMFFGVVIGFYTVKGSGIAERPYGKVYGGAPGARGPASVSGRDSRERMADWTRGTR